MIGRAYNVLRENPLTAIGIVAGVLVVTAAAVIYSFAHQGEVNTGLIKRIQGSVSQNHRLACRIGGFLIDSPVVQQPGMTDEQFASVVGKAEKFLLFIRRHNCSGVGGVTTRGLNAELHKLHKAVPKGGGHSSSPPGSSPPGGGPSPRPSPPPPTPPPTTPPPTTTTPPPNKPGPVGTVTKTICHLNPLGVRVCVQIAVG